MAIQTAPRSSTCFFDLTWDDESGDLVMDFHRGGQYTIPNFPQREWEAWSNASSLGGYFNSNIKGRF
jgi:hypothetical protein